MASKSAYHAQEKGAEIEELLDGLEKLIERLRAMYEQYFLGIAKTAPSQLHTDAERKLRDLTQIQIKNTGLRYRFATLSQKFGAYNTYWKRTLRLIEQGKYVRDLQRVSRRASRAGEDIPEEILAAMPKLMRERVARDRAQAEKVAARQGRIPAPEAGDAAAARRPGDPGNLHRIDAGAAGALDDDLDIEAMFASLTADAEAAIDARPRAGTRTPPPLAAPPPLAPPDDLDPPTERTGAPAMRPPPRATGSTTRPPPIQRPLPGMAGAPPRPGAPTAAPRPVAAAPSRPVPASRSGSVDPRASTLGPPPGMSESETRALYTRYLKARELCGESNDGVTYDKLVRTLRSQSSKIMTNHKAQGVEFGVVIKDNKVVLKAKPKV